MNGTCCLHRSIATKPTRRRTNRPHILLSSAKTANQQLHPFLCPRLRSVTEDTEGYLEVTETLPDDVNVGGPGFGEMSRAVREGKIAKAERLFNQLETRQPMAYNRLLNGFLGAEEYKKAWQLYEEMKDNDVGPDMYTYSILLNLCVNQLEYDKALEIWNKIEADENVQFDKLMYNSMIQLCGSVDKMPQAMEYFSQMSERGVEPDVVIYNTLIHALSSRIKSRTEVIEQLNSLLQDMEGRGVAKDCSTYRHIIKLLLKLGQRREAAATVSELMESGLFITERVYVGIILEYLKTGKNRDSKTVFVLCWRLYLHSSEHRSQPSRDILEVLLRLFATWESWSNAFAVLDEMVDNSIYLTKNAYYSILKAMASVGSLGPEGGVMCDLLVEEMKDKNIVLTASIYEHLIVAYLKCRGMESARFYLEEMKRLNLRPPAKVYSLFISYFADVRFETDWQTSLKEVQKLIPEMEKKHMHLSFYSWTKLLLIIIKNRDWGLLESKVLEMENARMRIGVETYNLLLSCCSKWTSPEDVKIAWKFYDKYMDESKYRSSFVFNMMMTICNKTNDMDGALRVLKDKEMSRTTTANDTTHDDLIKLCLRNEKVDLAVEKLKSIPEDKTDVKLKWAQALVRRLGAAGDTEHLISVFEVVKATKGVLNDALFRSLIAAGGNCSKADFIYEVYEEYKSRDIPLDGDSYLLMASQLEINGDSEKAAEIRQLAKDANKVPV